MLPNIYRILLASMMVAGAATAHAQESAEHGAEAPSALCGTIRMMTGFDRAAAIRNTAARTPELYRQALAESRGAAASLLSAEEATFWAPDYVSMQYIQVKAVRVYTGRLARVWVDVRDTGRSDLRAKLPLLVRALEDSTAPGSRNPGKGIIDNDTEVFGPTPTTVGDGFQDFLLFDISEQSILGFFLPGDQTDEQFSNHRNMLYIDSREGMTRTTSVLNTLAHEFQHLIHFGLNPEADIFVNEGCSEVAGLMCGYPDRANTDYLRNTNTRLLEFPSDPSQSIGAYERALTVTHYLYEQLGDGVLHALPRSHSTGMTAINAAIASVDPAAAWSTLSKGFAVANWLQTSSDPRYGYRVKLTSSSQRQARPLRTYTASSFRLLDTVRLAQYGIGYIVYDHPGTLTLKLQGRYQYRAVAICYSGDSAEVLDIEPKALVTIGTGFPYDRVVLVLIELSNASQQITWAVNEAISGAESETIAATTRLETIAPNPAHGRVELGFSVAADGPLRLGLYSPTGQLVRTVVDGERLVAGSHRRWLDVDGLASGAYVARLSQGDRTETRLVIVR